MQGGPHVSLAGSGVPAGEQQQVAKQIQTLTDGVKELQAEVQENEAVMGRLLQLAVGAV